MTEKQRNVDGSFAVVHGGEAGIKSLQRGQEFRPGTPAALSELAVRAEVEADGVAAVVKRDAMRLQACADLFWDAVKAAHDAGDLDRLSATVGRYGWLVSKAALLWQQVQVEERRAARQNVGELVQALRQRATGGDDDDSSAS